MTMEERMQNGYLWEDTDEFMDEQAAASKLAFEYNQVNPMDSARRREVLEQLLGHLGEDTFVGQPITVSRGKMISIGKNCYINGNVTFGDVVPITIGDNTMIARNVNLLTTTHPVHPDLRKYMYSFPITIGNNVWIGAGAIVMPGITIGDNSVIGAGSIVTKDVPANVVAAGNPCRILREITDYDKEYYHHGRKVEL